MVILDGQMMVVSYHHSWLTTTQGAPQRCHPWGPPGARQVTAVVRAAELIGDRGCRGFAVLKADGGVAAGRTRVPGPRAPGMDPEIHLWDPSCPRSLGDIPASAETAAWQRAALPTRSRSLIKHVRYLALMLLVLVMVEHGCNIISDQ